MEDEQTGTALYVPLAVQDLWVSDNSIFFGLLRHCVRLGRRIWIIQRSCWDAEWILAAQIGRPWGAKSPQVPGLKTAPEVRYPQCLPPWSGPFY